MKAIKLRSSWFSFRKCKGTIQVCSHCKRKMEGRIGLSICKDTKILGGHTKMNLWICLGCIDEVARMMVDGLEEHSDELMRELI